MYPIVGADYPIKGFCILPVQARGHRKKIVQGDGLFPAVQVLDGLLWKKVEQFLVNISDCALIKGNADQSSDYAFGYRFNRMCIVRSIRMPVCLRDEITIPHDSQAVERDIVLLDIFEHPN